MRFVIGRVDDFEPGSRRIVKAGGRSIGVFRVEDRFFAVRNRCPHQGGPLAAGRVFPKAVADRPGEVVLDDAVLISCPWHGWQWDMRSGEAYAPEDPGVRTYQVSVAPGETLACAAAGADVRLVAETFSVTVEDDYVVLDA